MIKRFFKDSFIYSFSGIITGGIAFFLLPLYARVFNTFEFGIYEYLTIFGSFIGVTIALEITQGVARFVPENINKPAIKKSYASTSLWFTVLSFSLFIAFIYLFKKFWANLLLDSTEHANLLVISSLAFGFTAVANLINNQLRWELKSLKSAILSIITSAASIFFSFLFVYYFKYGIKGAFYGLIAGNALATSIGLLMAKNTFAWVFSIKHLKEMLSFSFPLVFSGMASFLANYIDRIAIKNLMSFEALAVYGVGFRIAAIAMLVMFGFQSAMTPLVFANYQKKTTPADIAGIFKIFTALALFIFSALSLFSNELIIILATPQYTSAHQVVPVLVLSILLARMYIFFPGIGIQKKTIIIAAISIISAIINLSLNYLLIPVWGIMGAALATCITALLGFGAYILFSQKYYHVPHKASALITPAIIIILLLIFEKYLNVNLNDTFKIISKSISLITVVAIIFIARLITISDIVNFNKKS